MSVKKYLLIVMVSTLLFLGVVGGLFIYDFLNSEWGSGDAMINPDNPQDTVVEGLEETVKGEPYNILVLGVDVEAKLTDVMIMCQVDPVDHKVSMMSIPRDTKVRVKGSTMKINASYHYGGVEQVIKTVKDLTGLPVNYYFLINTTAFRDTIDALDGVYYTVPRNMNYEDPLQNLYIHLKKGYQLLDGDKAEQLVRFRQYPRGDVDRIAVQQDFLREIIAQKLNAKYIAKIPEVYGVIEGNTSTNMTPLDMISAGKQLLSIDGANFNSFTLPGEGGYSGEVSYYFPATDYRDTIEANFKEIEEVEE